MLIAIIVTLLAFFLFCYRANYYQPKWSLLVGISSFLLCTMIASVSNWQFGLLFFVFLISSVYYSMYDYANRRNVFTEVESARTALSLIACGIVFLWLDKNSIKIILDFIPFLLILNVLIKVFIGKKPLLNGGNGKKYRLYGIGGNVSVDSTLVSLLVGLMLSHEYSYYLKEIGIACAVFSLVWNKATSGALGFISALMLWLILEKNYLIASVVGVGVLAIFIKHKTLLKDNGRFIIWNHMAKKLVGRKTALFGIGNGSYKVFMPMSGSQKMDEKSEARITIWAHNDIFQMFVESGIIGVLAVLIFFVSIVPTMGHAEWIFLVALLPNLLLNFTMHMANDCFLLMVAIKKMFLIKG